MWFLGGRAASQYSEEEGVTLTDSGETLGVDLRTRVKRMGAKEIARRKKCKVRFSLIKKAAGKKSTTSLSLFMEAYGLEGEEELSTLATQYWAEGACIGKWHHERKEALMKQVSRSSDVEASERSSWSGDVRDP